MSSQDPNDPTYSELYNSEILWVKERKELYAEIVRLKECILVEQSKLEFVDMQIRFERARYLACKDKLEAMESERYMDDLYGDP